VLRSWASPQETTGEVQLNSAVATTTSPYDPLAHPDRSVTVSVEIEKIRNVPLFADLADEQLAAIGDKLEARHANPGEHLSSEGGTGYFFFVIGEGAAECTRNGEVLAEFGPGDFFGEAAIFRTRRRTATVTATADSTVYAMFGADFAKLAADIPILHERIEAALDQRLPREDAS
jgi:CRP-like cAMP-binding protein